MQKQEFLDLFDAAIRAAKSVKNDDPNSPQVLKCIKAMNRLKKAPESLACDLVYTSDIGKSYKFFIQHQNPKISSEARLLWDLWLTYLYATGTKRSSTRDQDPMKKTGDGKRDKVREMLQKALAKVVDEVVEIEMKKRIASCDPSAVAVMVESVMFDKLGSFSGDHKLKYRSILFNMGDSSNPDLRKKVLLGEIDGERLVTMKREEMGSQQIQMEVEKIKENARIREENSLKMTLVQSDHMIVT